MDKTVQGVPVIIPEVDEVPCGHQRSELEFSVTVKGDRMLDKALRLS